MDSMTGSSYRKTSPKSPISTVYLSRGSLFVGLAVFSVVSFIVILVDLALGQIIAGIVAVFLIALILIIRGIAVSLAVNLIASGLVGSVSIQLDEKVEDASNRQDEN
jgi:hypothetical protein